VSAAITIEALPASYGDSLLVSCPVRVGTWRLLMDTGPDKSWPAVRDRLARLPLVAGRRHLDLVVVSHIDHDHIGAASALFGEVALALTYGDVWFNARHHLERGVAEGEALATLLGAPDRLLPWNQAFEGGPVSTPHDGGFVEVTATPDTPRLTVLSPTPRRLVMLATVWDRALDDLRRRRSNSVPEIERGGEFPDLEALAARPPRKDRAIPNGSSIALLIEHRGASALLAADAFPTVLGSALISLAAHRGVPLPFEVDAFKLSHHGSRANLLTALLKAVRATNYIVSTDNTRFGHPNDETLARVVLHGGDTPALCFNHATERNLRWADEALQQRYGFVTRFPAGDSGIAVALEART
jgi:beta-lactamase superfamily II metal-dependent hydrolase